MHGARRPEAWGNKGGIKCAMETLPIANRSASLDVGTDWRLYAGAQEVLPTLRRVVERTLQIALSANVASRKGQCALLLEPPQLRQYRPLDFRKASELFAVGYEYTLSRAAELHALLAG